MIFHTLLGFVFLAIFIFGTHKTESGETASFVMAMMCFGFAMILDKLDQILKRQQ